MTYHLLFPALALLLAASTMIWTQARNQPVYAAAQTETSRSTPPGRGFTGAFGNGEALRNLLYAN